ncbi:MAG: hypothetical protein Q9169_006962 [Polycauliona sp. 2 TL-2023]
MRTSAQEEPVEDPAVAAAVSSVSEAESAASATRDAPTAAASSAAASSASASGSAPPAAETSSDSTAAASSTTSDSAAASSGSSTSSSVIPTPTVSCHKSSSVRPEGDIQDPFCEPKPDDVLVVGQSYPLTWDPTLFNSESTVSVRLSPVVSADEEGNTNTTIIWKHQGVRNEVGKVDDFQIHEDDFEAFNLKNNTRVTLFISSAPSDKPDVIDKPVMSGPTLFVVVSDDYAKNGTNSDSHIGEKAGIPVGLGVFLIAVAGLVFWFLRRRRNKSAGYMSKRKGAARMTGDESGVGGGFTDEPTRGMELQDRQGHGRQDSWDAGWDSTSSQGGGGNTFRDEIDRQRRR